MGGAVEKGLRSLSYVPESAQGRAPGELRARLCQRLLPGASVRRLAS